MVPHLANGFSTHALLSAQMVPGSQAWAFWATVHRLCREQTTRQVRHGILMLWCWRVVRSGIAAGHHAENPVRRGQMFAKHASRAVNLLSTHRVFQCLLGCTCPIAPHTFPNSPLLSAHTSSCSCRSSLRGTYCPPHTCTCSPPAQAKGRAGTHMAALVILTHGAMIMCR